MSLLEFLFLVVIVFFALRFLYLKFKNKYNKNDDSCGGSNCGCK
jgi:hypothetical protein